MLEVLAIAAATMFATGLGVIPVAALGPVRAEKAAPALWRIASLIMLVAAVGLLIGGFDRDVVACLIGASFGAAALLLTRKLLDDGLHDLTRRRATLVVGTLTAHSLPEGLAIGAALATEEPLGLVAVIAIGLQNIPEGTAAAIPLAHAGVPVRRQVGLAILTSVSQPIGAVIAYAATESSLAALPYAYGAAGGAMAALVIAERALGAERSAPEPAG